MCGSGARTGIQIHTIAMTPTTLQDLRLALNAWFVAVAAEATLLHAVSHVVAVTILRFATLAVASVWCVFRKYVLYGNPCKAVRAGKK